MSWKSILNYQHYVEKEKGWTKAFEKAVEDLEKYTEEQFTGASEVLKIFCKAINADYESGYTISNTNNTGKIKEYVLNELKL